MDSIVLKAPKGLMKSRLSSGLNAKRHVWRKPGTIPTVKQGDVFQRRRLVRIKGKMNGAGYREILDEENLLQSAQNLKHWVHLPTEQ
jgi:hypothetical protein